MKQDQNIARIVGLLFLLPFFTYGIGNGLIMSVLNIPDFLPGISTNKLKFMTGAVLVFMNSVIVVGIGVMLFPILEKENKRIALGYLSTRIMESLILIIGLVSLLSLITISDEFLKAASTASVYFDTLSFLARKANFWAYQMAMITLGLGSLGFCYLLYQSKLIPAFIAVSGLVGYTLLITGAVLELFGYTVGILLSLPGGLFEITLGIWLMVKGFTTQKYSLENRAVAV